MSLYEVDLTDYDVDTSERPKAKGCIAEIFSECKTIVVRRSRDCIKLINGKEAYCKMFVMTMMFINE